MTSTPDILHEQPAEGVLCLRFNRPKKKNALTLAMYDTLTEHLAAAAKDDAIRAVLFTGSEESFTSGNDLMDFMQAPPQSVDSPVFRFLLALIDFPKPVLAAVNGLAIGIGTTMLMHCDIVFAASTARFRMPFVPLGLVPEAASSLILPQLVGLHHASELLMTGRFFDAREAKEIGFVRHLTPPEELFNKALEMAKTLAAQPPEAIRLTKSLIRAPLREKLSAVLHTEGNLFIQRLQSAEAQEAFMRFFASKA